MKKDAATTAIVIKVGDRFFSHYKNKRICTAWCLAGSMIFQLSDEHKVEKYEKILHEKGYETQRAFVKTI